jgi:hypothetical protein
MPGKINKQIRGRIMKETKMKGTEKEKHKDRS